MMQIQINESGFLFSIIRNGDAIQFNDWKDSDDCIYYMPLSTLVDNGNASINYNGCIVPFGSVYLLDAEERLLLGLPKLYDKYIRVRSDGVLNSSDFRYIVEFLASVPDGMRLPMKVFGNVISYADEKFLLHENQYKLLRLIEDFNKIPTAGKNAASNMRVFSEVKNLVGKSVGCKLDDYLENENVLVSDTIRIGINHDGDKFKVLPNIDSEYNSFFQTSFDRIHSVKNIYPVQREDGSRIRVVFNEEQKNGLESIRRINAGVLPKEQLCNIIERPTEYFNPDFFDLSELYSDRVIEIGLYKPKFYPFVSPYKSCWIAGADVQVPNNGTTRITISNDEELQLLKDAISSSDNVVQFNGTYLDMDDAVFLAKHAEKQLNNPQTPIKMGDNKRTVLIIEENADDLGFYSDSNDICKSSFYELSVNTNLNDSFLLKEHQKEGVAWFQYLYKHHASGCLMADDMGLGKTLQVLYFIDWLSSKEENHNPYLIVAPVSLLENWENEYYRFFKTPRLKVCKLSSREIPRRFDKKLVDEMQKMDIIMTNYESLRNSQLNFCAVQFDVVVLDEAQKIKTPGTLVTNASKALKGKFKIAMTGTPVENSLVDLWCIMDFCVPGLLGNAKTFANEYHKQLNNADIDINTLGNKIHDRLGIYFMRRMKSTVAKDLPEKHIVKECQLMPEIQSIAYSKVIDEYKKGVQPNMLVTLFNMRTISEHPYIFDFSIDSHTIDELINTSARLIITLGFIKKIQQSGEKVILFAERKDTQRMLQKIIYEQFKIVPKIINGDTPSIVSKDKRNQLSRQASIDSFQSVEGFNVIIMSPIAAGMGLNVTAANHVIHYSRHWNPAKENQATDRVYRIGQTKDVFVYYPMATNHHCVSFDETLDILLERKTELAKFTIFPSERLEVRQEELAQMLELN